MNCIFLGFYFSSSVILNILAIQAMVSGHGTVLLNFNSLGEGWLEVVLLTVVNLAFPIFALRWLKRLVR